MSGPKRADTQKGAGNFAVALVGCYHIHVILTNLSFDGTDRVYP